MLNYIMIFYFSFYLIPSMFISKSNNILVFLPGIIFCIGMCLYLHYIDKLSYPIIAFTYIIWIVFSRFHFGLIVSRLAMASPAWKTLIFWGVFIGFTYHKLHSLFGSDCIHDFVEGYKEIKARFLHEKINKENTDKKEKANNESDSSNKNTNRESFHKEYLNNMTYQEAAKKLFENCKTDEDKKSIYRKLMKIYHPDQPNGDPELCKAIKEVYESM